MRNITADRDSFNPRSPWGERLIFPMLTRGQMVFQSTLPVGGATPPLKKPLQTQGFQSTLPVGGATSSARNRPEHLDVSIHAPRGGSDSVRWIQSKADRRFQSTLPVGGATVACAMAVLEILFQSTLPVGGATASRQAAKANLKVSIHAPRGGSDLVSWLLVWLPFWFQSTLPVGGATSDGCQVVPVPCGFNPRSPWGERQAYGMDAATAYQVSIHAPRGGSDK